MSKMRSSLQAKFGWLRLNFRIFPEEQQANQLYRDTCFCVARAGEWVPTLDYQSLIAKVRFRALVFQHCVPRPGI
jgi:hypothetical protein